MHKKNSNNFNAKKFSQNAKNNYFKKKFNKEIKLMINKEEIKVQKYQINLEIYKHF